MAAHAVPALYAVLIWWFSTGLIILLDHRPRHTHPWSMAAGTLVLMAALYAIGASAGDTSEAGAYTAFTASLLVWGWQEMSYYMGYVAGPRKTGCPPTTTGFALFRAAAATSLWHEAAIVAGMAGILALTWGEPNKFALWTYLILWGMNLSARLNMFLGVRNLNAEFLPERLGYLACFLRNRRMNALFPFSVAIAALVTILLARAAMGEGVGPHEIAGFTIVTTLMALATLEHGFLMLPLPSAALWAWSLPKAAGTPNRPSYVGEGACRAGGVGSGTGFSGEVVLLSRPSSSEATMFTHLAGTTGPLSWKERDRVRCVTFSESSHTSPQPSPSRRGSSVEPHVEPSWIEGTAVEQMCESSSPPEGRGNAL